jgi:cell division protein FtsL
MIRRKWSAREIALGTAFVTVVLGLLTFYIWYQTEAIRMGKIIEGRKYEISALREEIDKLEVRRAELLAPAVVDRIARDRLGLRDPAPGEIIHEDTPPAAEASSR